MLIIASCAWQLRQELQYLMMHYFHSLVYFPTLIVKQMLKFAATTHAPHKCLENSTHEDYVNDMTNVIGTIFGLNYVLNMLAGDASMRGISGGQKKRVSIGEMMAARTLVGAWSK